MKSIDSADPTTAKTDVNIKSAPYSAHEKFTMLDILDLAHFRVYVVDVLSHEVVYANDKRRPQEANGEAKCYQIYYRECGPCLSCKIARRPPRYEENQWERIVVPDGFARMAERPVPMKQLFGGR